MSATTGEPGRTIALFPGAFRPPHVNHLETVRQLAARPDIDEVVVIVTNRWRAVPGTNKLLGPEVAQQIWSIYLVDTPEVRVEVADGSAVSRALDYVEHSVDGDRLLLVVGSKEATEGRGRFAKLRDRTRPSGVEVEVTTGAPDVWPVSATDLRRALGTGGERGRASFLAGLPASLDELDQQRIWELCREAMTSEPAVTIEQIAAVLDANGLEVVDEIRPATAPKRDLIYQATSADRGPLYIKYANDTVSSAGFDDDDRKPRRRLKAEREALKCLHRTIGPEDPAGVEVVLPAVVCFDKAAKTLVLTEAACGRWTLGDELDAGRFDPAISATVARFLAHMHDARPREPLWDDPVRDLERWQTALAAATSALPSTSSLGSPTVSALRSLAPALEQASNAARRPGVHHLDVQPRQVLLADRQVAVIDFERASSIGDPALDLGSLLAHYLLAGLDHGGRSPASAASCRAAIESALLAYHRAAGQRWAEMEGRVVGFAGMALLGLAARGAGLPAGTGQLVERALVLVRASCRQDGEPAASSLAEALSPPLAIGPAA